MIDSKDWFWGLWIFFAAIIVVIVICLRVENEIKDNYKQGYIDACKDFYKGSVKAELVENKSGERIWVYKK